jgi:hypothetical protein
MVSDSRPRSTVSALAFALLILLGGAPQAVAGAAHRAAPGDRPHGGGVSPLAIGTEHSMSNPTYSASSANDVSPSVAFDGAEYLEVAWSGTIGLRGVVVAANGRILTPGGFPVASTNMTAADDRPRVASNGSGFLVVWASAGSVLGARVTPGGSVLDNPPIVIRAGTGSDSYTQPQAASDGAGYAVVWTHCAGVSACPAFPDQSASPVGSSLETALVSSSGSVTLAGTLAPSAEVWNPAIAWNGTSYLVAWANTGATTPTHFVPTIDTERLTQAGAFQSPETNVGHALGWQDQPTAASNGGAFLVAWTDGAPSTAQDVKGGRVAPDGTGLDASVIAISAAANAQSQPAAAWDGSNYVVAWRDTRSDAGDVYGGRVSAGGSVLDGTGFVVDSFSSGEETPGVAAGAPGTLVVWDDIRTGSERDVYAARVSPAAGVLDPTGMLLTTATGGVAKGQFSPVVAWDGANYLGVWGDGRNGVDSDVYGGRVDGSGAILDGTGIPISTAAGEQSSPSIAWNGAEYLAVWQDHRGSRFDVYGARIAPNGTVLDPFGIPISTAGGDQRDPRVVANGSQFLVVWDDSRGANLEVYATRVDGNGSVLDPSGIDVSSGATSDQELPAVAWNGSHYLVAWEDFRADVSGDVEAARLSPSGTVLDPSGIPVAATPSHGETDPSVATDGAQFLVAWTSDDPSRGTAILASLVSDAGVVAVPAAVSDAAANDNDFAAATWDGSLFFVPWSGLTASFDVLGARVTQGGARFDPASLAVSTGPDQSFAASVAPGPMGRTAVVYDREASESAYQGADHTFLRFFDESPPSISGFSPPAATVGTTVTVTGSGFVGATAVTFDGVPATTFSVASDAQLTAEVPDGASTGPIAVTTPLGTGSSSTDLLVKPKVKSFSPASGPVGTIVTIKGTAFTGATKVMFTGHKGKILTVAYGKITVRVLSGTVTGPITVVTTGGKSTSKKSFTVT